jgi:purine-binding chemotaxis protein CheW
MSELLLVVRLAGERVAITAGQVESVVEIEAVTPVPRAAPHIAGLAALRSRVLTVIDCHASLEPGRAHGAGSDAIVVVADGHPYALLVDSVEDVIEAGGEILPVRTAPGGNWGRVARGMVEAEGTLLLLVDPLALISGPRAMAA